MWTAPELSQPRSSRPFFLQPRSANNAACPNREPPSQLSGAITYARVTGQGGRESGRFIWGLWCGQVPLAVLHFHIICCFELLPPRGNNGTILQPAIRIWLGLLPHSAATNAPCTISATWAAAGHPFRGSHPLSSPDFAGCLSINGISELPLYGDNQISRNHVTANFV